MSHYNIPIFVSHQGCPFQCIYCNQRMITGCSDAPDEKLIRQTIEKTLSTMKPDDEVEIAFFGGSFTLIDLEHQKKYLSIAAEYVYRHQLQGIRISTRPDGIDWHIMDMLSHYPVSAIELGVQSLDERVLKASGRGHGVLEVLRAVRMIQRYEMRVGLQMMIGLPEDNYDRSIYTAEKIAAMKPDFVRIYPTVVLKDTPLEKLYREGKYLPWELDEVIEATGDVVRIFFGHHIPIVRLGLYSNDPAFLGQIVAGPYHPAIKDLVYSRLFRNSIERTMELGEKELQVECSPKDISLISGHNRQNQHYFKEIYGISKFSIRGDEKLSRNHFRYRGKVYHI